MRSSLSGNLHFYHWGAQNTFRTQILYPTVFRGEMFMVLGSSTLDWSMQIIHLRGHILIRTVTHSKSQSRYTTERGLWYFSWVLVVAFTPHELRREKCKRVCSYDMMISRRQRGDWHENRFHLGDFTTFVSSWWFGQILQALCFPFDFVWGGRFVSL